ncbi:MmgE/PrpD family protein [Jatrophihabitans endophyticus]|uniref:MmgE/PrpD family protein n=1 Tax=Jatrophihabitans endophyticus TaxID=1206085 RepID=UPI001A07CE82|nr:MmgE/PrpD family protein [Jatrophihabitans endophyticus]MBE7187444.1 MmgE/PrpD family protein [Jatrophihabitans endophyticus]
MTAVEQRPEQLTGHLAQQVGEFAAGLRLEDVPDEVVERARHLILDAVGLAFVTSRRDFADQAVAAASSLDAGTLPLLGRPETLTARDAALVNGVLVHGLDFDDTHLEAVTHVTASALPAALSAAVAGGRTGAELLAAYIAGIEVTARVGMGARGAFHDVGFHPTAVAGAFGSAVAAGKLAGLDAQGIATAQAIVGSMASGLLEFLEDGSWTKRLHPGWAAQSGIAAAAFAAVGWTGPASVYEGRFGLYNAHLGPAVARPQEVADGLGERWELPRTSVKPYAACHFTHAFIDAALALREQGGVRAEDVTRIVAGIPVVPGRVVAEPIEVKRNPRSEYDAKFSLPFTIAAALVRGRFTLTELEEDARRDPAIAALAERVEIVDDPDSAFPQAYSGVVTVTTADGVSRTRREQVNRGHETRPLTNDDVVAKFRDNLAVGHDSATARRVLDAVLSLGRDDGSAADFAAACRG